MKLCRKHINYLSSVIGRLDDAITELAGSYGNLFQSASDVPVITVNSARYIIAEIGVDMTVFKSAKHLCSRAGLTPQNYESANKKKSYQISRAGVYLKPLLLNVLLLPSRTRRSLISGENMNASRNVADISMLS